MCANLSVPSRSLPILTDCCLWNTFDSEVNLELFRHRFPYAVDHADENRRVGPARLPSK